MRKKKTTLKEKGISPEQHQRIHSLLIGYAAFLFAFFLGLSSFTEKTANVSVVMGLILISLPSVISLLLIDFIVRVKQRREASAIRGFAFFMAFAPGVFALGIYVWPYAWWASVIFGILIPLWAFLVIEVGGARPDSKI
jgi:hypothetical protein